MTRIYCSNIKAIRLKLTELLPIDDFGQSQLAANETLFIAKKQKYAYIDTFLANQGLESFLA